MVLKTVFITGATGNIGAEVIKALGCIDHQLHIVAGVRDTLKATKQFTTRGLHFRKFDFDDRSTYATALQECDVLFLLRPPQIADVNKYFKPLISEAVHAGVQHIVFLSVQGVEDNRFIPHYKIEALIKESGIPYTFLRPAYFMQNFTTTLYSDLVKKQRVFLPAGRTRFTIVDVRDVGAVAARVLVHPERHINAKYDVTNYEKLSFGEMVGQINALTGSTIRYESPNLLRFFISKRREEVPAMFILVMIMLHYLPRFRKEPPVAPWITTITGREPLCFEKFVNDNRELFLSRSPAGSRLKPSQHPPVQANTH